MNEQFEDQSESPETLAEKMTEDGIQNLGERYIDIFYEKARSMLREDKIDPDNFEYYDKEMIARDKKYVEEMKSIFSESNTKEEKISLKFATVLEAIIDQHTTLSNWLGERAHSRQASDFDNYKNGIEFETEQPESTSHLGLAMDVTFSNNLSKKISRIKDEIDKDELPEIKYFESEIEDSISSQGRVRDLPRVIIAFDTKSLSELAALWIQGKNSELGNHPAQILITEEILLQLKTYREYAQANNQRKIVRRYDRSISIVESIKLEKEELYLETQKKHGQSHKDNPAFINLQKNLKIFR